jgi:hypothetical protein
LKLCLRSAFLALVSLTALSGWSGAQDLPKVKYQDGVGQFLLHGKPYLILGGELGNSSAGKLLPRLGMSTVFKERSCRAPARTRES